MPLAEEIPVNVKTPKLKPDLKVILERRDGGRIQFTLYNFYGKLIGNGINMAHMQFGRRLGQIFKLWSIA